MSFQEASLLLDAHNTQYKEDWERLRWQCYVTAASNGAKLKKPQDLIKFNWETGFKPVEDSRTEEQKKAALEKLKQKFIKK